jgi:hypothetical protein
MSDEQFEKLLKAIANLQYPHVCPPCMRPHLPAYYYPPTLYPITYTSNSTTTPFSTTIVKTGS